MNDSERRAAGLKARRAVLGDAHVDNAIAQTTELTAEFQDLLTRYAWGEIWTRPGLDLRSRRLLVLGTLVALERWDEFRLHVGAALADKGLSIDDIKEVALQQAIYCGIPVANAAFQVIGEVLTRDTVDRSS